MKRLLEKQLQQWFKRKNRKPLILRGARQVGKSTLIRQFAQAQQLNLIEINLEKHSFLNEVFKSNDLAKILPELEATAKISLQQTSSLLFLDEIQATPYAFSALRYFYEEKPTLPVIAAGSLLEFVLADHSFSMPVGRIDYLHLGPMTFYEFLLAMNENYLATFLEQYSFSKKIPEAAHQSFLNLYRQYLFVGGMPESVKNYADTKSPLEARQVHRSIIQTYEDDFAKYAAKEKQRDLLHLLFRQIPKIVGKKVKYSQISPHHRSAELKVTVDLLIKARLFIPAVHSDCSGLPLGANENRDIYKIYFLDVGLYNYLCGLEWTHISEYSERSLIHEGVIAEQFIAQHLAYLQKGLEAPNLHYWLRENRSQNAELDFVISKNNKIFPIEVKSGKSGTLKSLQQFLFSKGDSFGIRFDLNLPSLQKVKHQLTHDSQQTLSFSLLSLPLYLVDYLSADKAVDDLNLAIAK